MLLVAVQVPGVTVESVPDCRAAAIGQQDDGVVSRTHGHGRTLDILRVSLDTQRSPAAPLRLMVDPVLTHLPPKMIGARSTVDHTIVRSMSVGIPLRE